MISIVTQQKVVADGVEVNEIDARLLMHLKRKYDLKFCIPDGGNVYVCTYNDEEQETFASLGFDPRLGRNSVILIVNTRDINRFSEFMRDIHWMSNDTVRLQEILRNLDCQIRMNRRYLERLVNLDQYNPKHWVAIQVVSEELHAGQERVRELQLRTRDILAYWRHSN